MLVTSLLHQTWEPSLHIPEILWTCISPSHSYWTCVTCSIKGRKGGEGEEKRKMQKGREEERDGGEGRRKEEEEEKPVCGWK